MVLAASDDSFATMTRAIVSIVVTTEVPIIGNRGSVMASIWELLFFLEIEQS